MTQTAISARVPYWLAGSQQRLQAAKIDTLDDFGCRRGLIDRSQERSRGNGRAMHLSGCGRSQRNLKKRYPLNLPEAKWNPPRVASAMPCGEGGTWHSQICKSEM